MREVKRMKQQGFIKFGATKSGSRLNKKRAMDDARKEGYYVRDRGGYAELWK